jgi:hypothetical protein
VNRVLSNALRRITIQLHASTPPAWWNEPTDNPFDRRGLTQGEVILDWLQRSHVEKVGDKYRFYHASPKKQSVLRAGSLLETDPEKAQFFAARDRNLKPERMIVHEVLVYPWEIHTGVWAALEVDYHVQKILKV